MYDNSYSDLKIDKRLLGLHVKNINSNQKSLPLLNSEHQNIVYRIII